MNIFMALYISYLTSWCPHGWLQMLFLVYLFIWTGNVSVTFQMFWTLHWQKPFTGNNDQMHMLWLCLAGLMDMFLIFLPPSASHPGQMPQEPDLAHFQSSIPFPSHVAARHVPTVPSLLSCSSRIKSSSGMAEHLKMSPWTPATSTGTALCW